ncbi:type VII secretion target [Actinoplanes sp. NPDC023801]|uniref:type VII secretion target n=1 Tax=Actinoplanes sp. NPDC023801 TaxID=3154595 RepID=UPI0033ED77CB
MSELVRVDPAALGAHARTVDEIAGRVATAGRRAQSVRAGPGAYGRLCAMFPPGLGDLQDALAAGVAAAADGLYDTGDRLRATARDYRAADERRAAAFRVVRAAR